MKKSFFLPTIAILVIQLVCKGQPYEQDNLKNGKINFINTTKIEQLVNTYTSRGLPGIIVWVRTGDLTWQTASGFSDIENKVRMQPTNELMIASVTKMFVAVVTLKLQEEGELDIDKPINAFKCGYRFSNIPNANKITIRHLLNHTSGLPDFIKTSRFVTNLLDQPSNNWKKDDLLKFLGNSRPEFVPGEKGKYSNSNFLLLSVILDEEFEDPITNAYLIQKGITDPLCLDHTRYLNRLSPPKSLAQGYADLYNNNHLINLTHMNISGTGNGYSGMISTAANLSEFLDALLIKRTLLNESSLVQMLNFTQDSEENALAFGLGIWKDFQDSSGNRFAYGHRGREAAYTTDLFWFPVQDIMYVLMMNCGIGTNSSFKELFLDLRKDLVTELLAGSNASKQK